MSRKSAVDPHPKNTLERYSWEFLQDAAQARQSIYQAFKSLLDQGYGIRDISHYLTHEVLDVELHELAGWGQTVASIPNEGD